MKLAEKAAGPGWYDEIYSQEGGSAGEKYVVPIHRWIAERVKERDVVVDLGCGPGSLAHLLNDLGHHEDYTGYDFSNVAVKKARKKCPWYSFARKDLRDVEKKDFDGVDVAVLCEVLEHIEDDLRLLRILPPGIHVLGSVPTFGGRHCHLRCFPSMMDVVDRYREDLVFKEICLVAKSWCFNAIAMGVGV